MQNKTYTIGQEESKTFITVLSELKEIRLTEEFAEERCYIPLSQIEELINVLQEIKQQGEL